MLLQWTFLHHPRHSPRQLQRLVKIHQIKTVGIFWLKHFLCLPPCSRCQVSPRNPACMELLCESNACLIDPSKTEELRRGSQNGDYTWSPASNYTEMWGRTLKDGFRKKLGTNRPERPVSYSVSMRGEPKPDSFAGGEDEQKYKLTRGPAVASCHPPAALRCFVRFSPHPWLPSFTPAPPDSCCCRRCHRRLIQLLHPQHYRRYFYRCCCCRSTVEQGAC